MKENELVERWVKSCELRKKIYEDLESNLSKYGELNLNEFYTLYFLNQENNKKMRLQDLGNKVGLSPSAMSRMVAKLEEKSCEVIKKEVCFEDKRNIYVRLTSEGEKKLLFSLKIINEILVKYKNQL